MGVVSGVLLQKQEQSSYRKQSRVYESRQQCDNDELSEFIVSVIKFYDITKNLHNECDGNEIPNLNCDRANVPLITFLYFMQRLYIWCISCNATTT